MGNNASLYPHLERLCIEVLLKDPPPAPHPGGLDARDCLGRVGPGAPSGHPVARRLSSAASPWGVSEGRRALHLMGPVITAS